MPGKITHTEWQNKGDFTVERYPDTPTVGISPLSAILAARWGSLCFNKGGTAVLVGFGFILDPSGADVLNSQLIANWQSQTGNRKLAIANWSDTTALNAQSSDTNPGPDLAPPAPHSISDLKGALRCLREGGVVAIPTDTLYGLAADVGNEEALNRIFEVKGRPGNLALPVLVSSWEQVGTVAVADDDAIRQLGTSFWPGSLTLVLPRQPGLSSLITGGLDTVAVRMPAHWIPLSLAAGLGRPITGTSANRSGSENLNSPQDIRESLGDSLGEIVDLGPAPAGLQSTIVDMTGDSPVLLREGATSFSEVQRVWEQVNAPARAGDKGGGRH